MTNTNTSNTNETNTHDGLQTLQDVVKSFIMDVRKENELSYLTAEKDYRVMYSTYKNGEGTLCETVHGVLSVLFDALDPGLRHRIMQMCRKEFEESSSLSNKTDLNTLKFYSFSGSVIMRIAKKK